MNWRLPASRLAILAALSLVAVIALLPMRVVIDRLGLERAGFSAREIRGPIWNATISEARFAGAALGDVDARLAPLPLLIGRARVDLSSASGMSAWIGMSRHTTHVRIERAVFENIPPLGPVRIEMLRLADVDARFAEGRCMEATGIARAGIELPWIVNPLPPVDARVRCDAGALLILLAAPGGGGAIELRVHADRRVSARAVIAQVPLEIAPLLSSAGARFAGGRAIVEREWRLEGN